MACLINYYSPSNYGCRTEAIPPHIGHFGRKDLGLPVTEIVGLLQVRQSSPHKPPANLGSFYITPDMTPVKSPDTLIVCRQAGLHSCGLPPFQRKVKGMDLLRQAIKFAENYHNGQTDKAGSPYVWHLCRVAERVDTEEEKVVAWLHDTLEDRPEMCVQGQLYSFELIYGVEVANALKAITRLPDESYADYIKRVKKNPLATKVKISDLIDNSNLQRLGTVTVEDVLRQKKYNKALLYLMKGE